MTRIAIVATSEELRTALATAIRTNPGFEVVALNASVDDLDVAVDVVLVAQTEATTVQTVALRHADVVGGPSLSNREREVLALLADGLGNKQIAARLGISSNTVKTHLELLFDKLGASSRAEAVALGVRRGLLLL